MQMQMHMQNANVVVNVNVKCKCAGQPAACACTPTVYLDGWAAYYDSYVVAPCYASIEDRHNTDV